MQAAAEAQKFVKRQLVQVENLFRRFGSRSIQSFLVFSSSQAHYLQAMQQAEEKSQALADACCDLVVTACELLQVLIVLKLHFESTK